MADCNGKCKTCDKSGNCAIQKSELNAYSKIAKVIGVVSGKGGVGKSTVTSLLARQLKINGYRVGIMDADITGPSIPNMFGVTGRLMGSEMGMEPALSAEGIEIVSMNLLLDNVEDAVILRGPVLAGVVKQFWTDVHWGELDYLLIDMPPGTGDVPLTVYQSIPIDGVVIVTSPQSLVNMIVAKAYDMARKMNVRVLGIVENYSYYECDNCKEKLKIFGESNISEIAEDMGITAVAKLPIVAEIARTEDNGVAPDEKLCGLLAPIIATLEEL